MKIRNIFAALVVTLGSSAYAQDSVDYVVFCGAGQPPAGWALTSITYKASTTPRCQSNYIFTWVDANKYPIGSQITVCGLTNLQNWWPIKYIPNNPGASAPCAGAGAYRYLIEKRG